MPTQADFDAWVQLGERGLAGTLGIVPVEYSPGVMRLALDVDQSHLAPNGYLHGGCVVSVADAACGYGCRMNLPEGVSGFTTVELKVNFLGTVTDGRLTAEARLAHAGRSTQVWDATVTSESARSIALLRATQILFYE
ncbi:MAG: PaaI family thioesterase [Actinomycetia bacterium]|nr:PaaI family thioesterase [Actinomycetes bacterium]